MFSQIGLGHHFYTHMHGWCHAHESTIRHELVELVGVAKQYPANHVRSCTILFVAFYFYLLFTYIVIHVYLYLPVLFYSCIIYVLFLTYALVGNGIFTGFIHAQIIR